MAYNADLQTALSMAPQLGTLSASTRPTVTQGNVIHARAYNEVRVAFRAAGLSDSVTASSLAEGFAQEAEMMLTSGYVLLSKGSVGKDAESTAKDLLALGKDLLKRLLSDFAFRMSLLDNGADAADGSSSPFVSSDWIREKDPDFDETAGTGDIPYAYYPPLDEGSDL